MENTIEKTIETMANEKVATKEEEMKKEKDVTATPVGPKLNRAQRRAQKKRDVKMNKQLQMMMSRYIAKHPEAIKVDLDEDTISELESQEKENVNEEVKKED